MTIHFGAMEQLMNSSVADPAARRPRWVCLPLDRYTITQIGRRVPEQTAGTQCLRQSGPSGLGGRLKAWKGLEGRFSGRPKRKSAYGGHPHTTAGKRPGYLEHWDGGRRVVLAEGHDA